MTKETNKYPSIFPDNPDKSLYFQIWLAASCGATLQELAEKCPGTQEAVNYMKELQEKFNSANFEAYVRLHILKHEAPDFYHLTHQDFKNTLERLFSDSDIFKEAEVLYNYSYPYDPAERSSPIDWTTKIGHWEVWVDCRTVSNDYLWKILFREVEKSKEDESSQE